MLVDEFARNKKRNFIERKGKVCRDYTSKVSINCLYCSSTGAKFSGTRFSFAFFIVAIDLALLSSKDW
jgi:hypothetical protein